MDRDAEDSGERGGTDLGGRGGKGGTERTEQEKDVCFSTYFLVKVNLHSEGKITPNSCVC